MAVGRTARASGRLHVMALRPVGATSHGRPAPALHERGSTIGVDVFVVLEQLTGES